MAYMTYYSLSATRAGIDMTEDLLPVVIAHTGMDARYFEGEEDASWYDHDEDMKTISERHPDVVFRLYGVGDGVADIWVNWYCNGKMQCWDLELALPDSAPLPWREAT